MDIAKLKDKLGDETFASLQGYVNDLIGQRDAARNESINGRKGKDQQITDLKAELAEAYETAGVAGLDELKSRPNPKAAVEEAAQLSAKLKRAERERDDAKKLADEASGKFRGSLQKAAIAEALGGHEFIARDIVETFVSQRLTWEGDERLFKSDDGKLIPVKDGVAGIAKTRPELLKPTGTGGAGVRQSNAGSGGAGKTMTRAEFEALPPAQRVEQAKAGVQLT
jgi:hypothetical protein